MKLNKIIITIFVVFSFFLMACGEDESNASDNGFESSDGARLSNSIIDLPASLSSSPEDQKARSAKNETEGDDEMVEIYEGIRGYVGIADHIKNGVKKLLSDIGEILPYLPVDAEFIIPNPTEKDPKRVKLEMLEDEEYLWKLSFYFTETEDAELIVRFSLIGDGAKGRLLWEFEIPDENLAAMGIHLNVRSAIDIIFDGTTTVKELEIKFIHDMDAIISLALDGTFDSLTYKQKEKTLGQPNKVFLNTILDLTTNDYTIYGASYHPGWTILNYEIFGENRTMYLFKAKAKHNTSQEAKLYLSLPLKTRDNITGVWEEDSVSEIVTDFLWNKVNEIIGKLADSNDDLAEDPDNPDDPFLGNMAEEQLIARFMVICITGLDPESSSQEYSVTKEQLETFVSTVIDPLSPLYDQNTEDFRNSYKSIKYMINPAFYDSANGFLGAYDESKDIFFVYENNSLAEGAKPDNFSRLNSIDLSDITPYVPAEVLEAIISVE